MAQPWGRRAESFTAAVASRQPPGVASIHVNLCVRPAGAMYVTHKALAGGVFGCGDQLASRIMYYSCWQLYRLVEQEKTYNAGLRVCDKVGNAETVPKQSV